MQHESTRTAAGVNWLTVGEFAEEARISVPTVYRWVSEDKIPYWRVGSRGKIRIPASALEALGPQEAKHGGGESMQ